MPKIVRLGHVGLQTGKCHCHRHRQLEFYQMTLSWTTTFDGFKMQLLLSMTAAFDKISIVVVHDSGIFQLVPKCTTLGISLG